MMLQPPAMARALGGDVRGRNVRPDGSIGRAPGHGIVLIGMGPVACDALERSGLGMIWDRRSLVQAKIGRMSSQTTPYSWGLRGMHEVPRRDGIVVLFGDDSDDDEIYVEPAIAAFVPINGNLRCGCGAHVQSWNIRRVIDGYELTCPRCHCSQARIRPARKRIDSRTDHEDPLRRSRHPWRSGSHRHQRADDRVDVRRPDACEHATVKPVSMAEIRFR
jgi:hypothetical protein